MSVHRALAPAKINLGLFVGPARASDGRHELASVMQSLSLADELTLEPAAAGAERDEVLCPGAPIAGENLAATALRAFRESTGWRAPPQRLSIVKRIPVAAGMGGGSADAAAALRLVRHASGLGDERLLLELAATLGADVPAQVAPGRWLASGAGERLEALREPPGGFSVLVLALDAELSTAAVYAEADRLAATRDLSEVRGCGERLAAALAGGEPLPAARELLHNDLQDAAVSLCPRIVRSLEQAREAGADTAFVSGSGPTVVGLFAEPLTPAGEPATAPSAAGSAAARAAASLAGRSPKPLCALPVNASFAEPVTVA